MRRYSANYILPVSGEPIKNGIIVVDSDGTIAEIIDPKGKPLELPSMEYHSGILVPGLVNTHCHLELSHLKGALTAESGLAKFVSEIKQHRSASTEEIVHAANSTDRQMYLQGTVAVGDVCNSDITATTKESSNIKYHSFFEVLGLSTEGVNERVDALQPIFDRLKSASNASYAPHSVYSLSAEMWMTLSSRWHQQLTTIHYKESAEEVLLLATKAGPLADLFTSWGLPLSLPSGDHKSIVSQYLQNAASVILVHNTFVPYEELKALRNIFPSLFLAICPISNLFIEKTLPSLSLLQRNTDIITLGTDSYASSNSLSVFQQMLTLSNHYPQIPFSEMLKWATLNGAKALNFDRHLGSFEVGKQPGINLIQGYDFTTNKLRPNATLTRLV